MIKKIVLLSLIAILFSCEKKSDSFEINASIDKSLNNNKAELFKLVNQKKVVIDSTIVADDKISFQGTVDSPDIYYILIDGIKGGLPIILENTEMDITIYGDSINKSIIKGSKENDITKIYEKESRFLRDYNDGLRDKFLLAQKNKDTIAMKGVRTSYDSLVKESYNFDKAFLKKHNNTAFAAITLERLTKGKAIEERETEALYGILSDDVKKTRAAKEALDFIKKEETIKTDTNAVSIGNVAPNFTGLTPQGKTLALNDIKARVTIIDFWASWCKPCRSENPNVVKMYNKYHDKGLEILGVSLDNENQKERWVNAIEKDGLTWPQISNLKGWQEPIAQQYGVRSIPATFVLDENGKIISKNLRGNALEEKVAELLN